MLLKYRPEDKAAKKDRLLKEAQTKAEGKTSEARKPIVVKYDLNHVTYLIEHVLRLFNPSNRSFLIISSLMHPSTILKLGDKSNSKKMLPD